jgi:glycerophosphoryl diester phosphodiesterase
MTKIIGHRGSGIRTKVSGKPIRSRINAELENTIAGFKTALKIDLDAIEFDVLSTKDEVLVVCHDNDLQRLSGLKKSISQLTYSELSEIHLHNNETIPLLYDVLSIIGKTPVIIDLKTTQNTSGLMDILLKFPEMKITITTYHRELIKYIKSRAPHIPVFVHRAHTPLGFRISVKKYAADGLTVKYTLLNPLTYWALRRKGVQVQIYTVDNIYVARFFKLLYPGIWICTNNPDKLLADNFLPAHRSQRAS